MNTAVQWLGVRVVLGYREMEERCSVLPVGGRVWETTVVRKLRREFRLWEN